jgi:tRNA pseudouridine55 synthase
VLGVLLIDKPIGMTSHDVVNRVRRMLGTRRVGHAGTLDPLATGVLVVAVGPATRFLQYLPLEPKEYVAQVAFGRSTTTFDAEGETTAEVEVPDDLDDRIEAALPNFTGLIDQLPPMYSAVKVGGQPLYKAARRGEEVERASRRVHIATFETLAASCNERTMRVICSGGTYVRTLAHDLGEAIGVPAHLAGLRRTGVGRFREEATVPLERIDPGHLMPLHEALAPMPLVSLDPGEVRAVRDGKALRVDAAPNGPFAALCDMKGRVVSVVRVEGDVLRPECVIPAETMPDEPF